MQKPLLHFLGGKGSILAASSVSKLPELKKGFRICRLSSHSDSTSRTVLAAFLCSLALASLTGCALATTFVSDGHSSAETGSVAVKALSCVSKSMTGAGTDSCTITLSAAAGTAGQSVSLSSSSSAVVVPATVTVEAGTTSATFKATISAVSTAQTATLKASSDGATESYAISLAATTATTPTLTLSATSLNFGECDVAAKYTESVTLSSTGTAAVTISSATISGSGFSVSGATFPLTLNPGKTATLTVAWVPVTSGTASGTLTISSDSSTNPKATVSLTGDGVPVLSGFSCSSSSITGAGTDVCTVTLNTPSTNDFGLTLSSSSSAVTVPASLTVVRGATDASFSATATAVSTAQTVTLTAKSWSISKTFDLQLKQGAVPVITSATSETGDVGSKFSYQITATNKPTSYGATGLPAGLAVNSSTGLISGTPTAAGASSVTLTATNAAGKATASMTLTIAAAVNGLSCSTSSLTGSTTDSCTVTLNAAAPKDGQAVSLSSNSTAVTVPSSVTVAAGATSASFQAEVSAVSTAQTATLTANAGGTSKSYTISLGAAVPTLTLSATSVSFGTVNVAATATKTVTLTSSGTATVTVSAGSVSGSGFTLSGVTFPFTLAAGKTATLTIGFDPTVAGAASGTVTLTSNSSKGTSSTIALSGTGQAVPYEVNITWDAPASSSVPVAGYNVYRALSGSSSYVLLNSSVDTSTSYTDATVTDGSSYTYYVVSVDAEGSQSAPSNSFTISIP
jgi:hypothetical protein